jgi:hypothetical protein
MVFLAIDVIENVCAVTPTLSPHNHHHEKIRGIKMTGFKFLVKGEKGDTPDKLQLFATEFSGFTLKSEPYAKDKRTDSTSLALLIYDGTLDADDVKFFDEDIRFSTPHNQQILWVNIAILNDSIISQKLEFSGIRCGEIGKISSVTCFDKDFKPLYMQQIDQTKPVEEVFSPASTEHLMIVFQIPQNNKFKFSILIRDKMAIFGANPYYPCDPQVGNDPPKP